jgi:hypothetical protein
MAEVTFNDFAKLAKRRGHNPESLAELFRGKIEDAREFFERVMAGRFKHEDRTAVVIQLPFSHQLAPPGMPLLQRLKRSSPSLCLRLWFACL